MEKYGLGNQQAVLALTVSTALRNKLKQSHDSAAAMEQELRAIIFAVQQVPKQPSLVEAKESVVDDVPPESSNISLPLVKLPNEKNHSTLVIDRKGKVAHKTKPPTIRKRVLENKQQPEEPVVESSKRVRANSVSEEVSAKVEEASATTRSVPSDAVVKVKSTPVARSKRSRSVEDGEAVGVHPVALSTGKRRKSTTL